MRPILQNHVCRPRAYPSVFCVCMAVQFSASSCATHYFFKHLASLNICLDYKFESDAIYFHQPTKQKKKKKFQAVSFKISGCASEILSISALQQLRYPSRKQLWDLYQNSLPRDIFYNSCPSLLLPTALHIKWEYSGKSSIAGIFLYPYSSWLLPQLYGAINCPEKILIFI